MNSTAAKHAILLLVLTLIVSVTTIACGKAEFLVSTFEVTPGKVAIGEPVRVKVDVTNISESGGTYNAILRIDGVAVETKAVTLSPGDTETVTFFLVRSEAGSFEVSVDDLSSTLTVVSLAEFELSLLTITPAEACTGESVTASVDITNVGQVEGTYNATLQIGGTDIEGKDVTISPGETRTVNFEFSIDEKGDYVLYVNGVTGNLKVIKPANFEFSSLVISPMEVVAGTTATVSVDLTNVGDIEGSYRVVLKAKKSRQPGGREEIESRDVVLAGGAKETVTFHWVQQVAGRYELEVGGLVGAVTVVEGILPTLHVGDKWVFREINEGAVYTRTETIIGEEIREGRDTYIVQVTYSPPLGGWISERTEWRDKETLDAVLVQFSGIDPAVGGVVSRSIKTTMEYLESPWPKTVPYSYFAQKTVTTTDVVGSTSSKETAIFYIDHLVHAKEQVEVPAGTFRCFKVMQYEVGNPVTNSWYSDIAKATVKYNSLTSDNSWELLSYSVENAAQ